MVLTKFLHICIRIDILMYTCNLQVSIRHKLELRLNRSHRSAYARYTNFESNCYTRYILNIHKSYLRDRLFLQNPAALANLTPFAINREISSYISTAATPLSIPTTISDPLDVSENMEKWRVTPSHRHLI